MFYFEPLCRETGRFLVFVYIVIVCGFLLFCLFHGIVVFNFVHACKRFNFVKLKSLLLCTVTKSFF